MSVRNKVTLALLSLGLSSAAFTATAAGVVEKEPVCVPGHVTTPCEHSAWDIAFAALWAEPSQDGFQFANVTNADHRHFYNIKGHFDAGIRIEASYHFWTGNDVDVNWTRYDDSFTTTQYSPVNAGGQLVGIASKFFNTADNHLYDEVRGTARVKYDAVNVEFGQIVFAGEHATLRFHMGGQYARVDNRLIIRGLGNLNVGDQGDVQNGSRDNTTSSAEFDGVGPRVGMDASIHMFDHFDVVGRGAVAMLVGDRDSTLTNHYNDVNAANSTSRTIRNKIDRAVLPAYDFRLGLSYQAEKDHGTFSVEGGWYFSTIKNVQRIIAFDTTSSLHNFGIHGPYLQVKWVGDLEHKPAEYVK